MAVYVLSDSSHQRIKIGYSATPQKRIKTHLTSNPGVEVLAVIEHGDRRMEKSLHRLLDGHRCSGTTEWFWNSAEVRKVMEAVLGRV